MIGGMLTKQDVAARRGVDTGSISRYLAITRARLRAGQPLRPSDLPPPDDTRYGRPLWAPDGPIAEWLPRGRNNPRETQPEVETPA